MAEPGIPPARLAMAAKAVHSVLLKKKISHSFLGGYEIQLFGFKRHTKDVDVELSLPMLMSASDVLKLFEAGGFKVFPPDPTKPITGLRALYEGTDADGTFFVGIDVLISGHEQAYIKLPARPIDLKVEGELLPFFPKTHLFISKIICCARRGKTRDLSDVVMLYKGWLSELDVNKIKSKLKLSDKAAIEKQWPRDRGDEDIPLDEFYEIIDKVFGFLA
ncbi:hypothetical protein BXZ70DRAFT_1063798 [Cristinia sonorae]|uniref:Uncharacterized protein n=1 Tax=Cristinia sonorae TaxID=1940300 RepID=A0A8K0URF7_9AGAR|nr:hypothetical protein BXZ70DRAFT_1063798 [Cristinia sonorae]